MQKKSTQDIYNGHKKSKPKKRECKNNSLIHHNIIIQLHSSYEHLSIFPFWANGINQKIVLKTLYKASYVSLFQAAHWIVRNFKYIISTLINYGVKVIQYAKLGVLSY